ncbi:unnamed protein product [Mytilus coruscus]|uniref:Uncharacterized protein n=1 Tax=Mytilus coruscus TaxID=42192 RepID=A0A6J8BZQ5_MYTCO|nr:unnamed protein product [Mytilus coruscus]
METPTEEVKEIKASIRSIIYKLWNAALSQKGEFMLSEIIPVGSMEEGSRLYKADEFDFMIILKIADFDVSKLRLEEGCKTGYVKLFSDNPGHRWKGLFNNGQLNSWNFRTSILPVLRKVGDFSQLSSPLKLVKRDFSVVSNYQHFMLEIMGVHEIEAWNLALQWNGIDISVDTMPAIEINKSQVDDLETALGTSIFKDDHSRDRAFSYNQKCYLVPKGCQKNEDNEGCGCWLVDFAPSEVSMLKKMDQVHKNCQKFLKYIIDAYHGLPSYMIKTTVLEHVKECNDTSNQCAIKMLRHISDCLDNAIMPEHFLKDLNIFGWKMADKLKTKSPAVMAILFEHHNRVFKMLFKMLLKMAARKNWVVHQTPDLVSWQASVQIVEDVIPVNLHLILMHEFVDDLTPQVEKIIEKNMSSWCNISELRQGTKDFLGKLEWDPIEDFIKLQNEYLKEIPSLKPLF